MLVEQVDHVGPESFERRFGHRFDVLRMTVETAGPLGRLAIDIKAELGGDHYLVASRRKSFADQLFVYERSVDLGGVEERHAALDSRSGVLLWSSPHESELVKRLLPQAAEETLQHGWVAASQCVANNATNPAPSQNTSRYSSLAERPQYHVKSPILRRRHETCSIPLVEYYMIFRNSEYDAI